jgi:hypothetical protein
MKPLNWLVGFHQRKAAASSISCDSNFESARLGEASGKDVEAFEQAMNRAVIADEANNLTECENALAEARRIFLGPK